MLSIDYTLLIQMANFLFLLFLLNIIVYRPIRKIIGQRNEDMESSRKMLEDLNEKAINGENSLQENIVGARKEGLKEKELLKSEGTQEEKTMLQEAHASAEEKLENTKTDIQGSLEAVRESLQSEVEGFSNQLVEKILGRSV